MNIFSFAKKINRPLILNGAMGSMLLSRNIKSHGAMWMSYANIESPETVLEVHKEYIEAGADIITANTFRTNPNALKSYSKIKQKRIVRDSVEIALKARGDLPLLIAGSNAPAEDCYKAERSLTKKEISFNHKIHIDNLIQAGSDFILNETQSHSDEIKIICKYCRKENIPFVISFFLKENLELLSGENIFEMLNIVLDYKPLAVGFNCIKESTFHKIRGKIPGNYNWGFYLNCGSGNYSDEVINCGVSPEEYSKQVNESLKKQPSFVGACCGSSPLHIRKIKELLDGRTKS